MKRGAAGWLLMGLILRVLYGTVDAEEPAAAEKPEEVQVPVEAGSAIPSVPAELRGMLAEATERVGNRQFAEAEKVIRAILEKYPGDIPAQHMLSAVLIEQRRYGEAKDLFESLVAEHPGDFRLLNNYAWFLSTATDRSFRDPPRALALAQDAVVIAPNVYNVWSTLAEAHYVNGNFDRAVRALRQCIDLAIQQKAGEQSIRDYQEQLARMQEAASVMSLVE